MRIRSRSRDRSRGGGGGFDSALTSLLSYGATDVWDFVSDQYVRGGLVGPSGLSITRASSGYAERADGTLVEFGSGVLRRTDKGVLVEGARTNLLLRSQEFGTTWTSSGSITLTPDALASPSGVVDASLVTADVAGNRGFTQTFTGTAAAHTFSIYAKPGSSTWFRIVTNDGSTEASTYFNLSGAGAVGTNAAANVSSIQALANGWYRLIITRTLTASASCSITLRLASADNTLSADIGASTYIWGAQVELGAFASSYIPTVASTVTRATDVVLYDYAPAGAFTVFVEYEGGGSPASENTALSLGTTSSSGSTVRIGKQAGGGTAEEAAVIVRFANVTQAWLRHGAGTANVGAIIKQAARIGTDDFASSVGGSAVQTDTSGNVPTIDKIAIGSRFASSLNPASGYIRRAAIIPSALSDANLQAITT